MKTSRIIKLLAGITVTAVLCSCGGGGGGGGGGTTDKGWSYHPGSNDPKTQAEDENQLLQGRTLFLQGSTAYTFRFEENGVCSVTRTLNGRDLAGRLTYTYTPSAATAATARFTITYDEEWVDIAGETETLNATFNFGSVNQASCNLRVNGTPVGEVPATFNMIGS